MVFVFYNKLLLRAIVFVIGVLSGVCAWHYIALSAQKLGAGGVRDALAIVSFLVAGWLVMLIAEVVDNHYIRAFGAMAYGVGAFVSYPWIFKIDAPKLAELQGGAQRLQFAGLAFWIAVGLAFVQLAILVTRLILDKQSYGRTPERVAAPQVDAVIGTAPPAAANVDPLFQSELQAIPIDQSPLLNAGPVQHAVAAVPLRTPGPVKRLSGVGGVYLGTAFELTPGAHTVGRQGAEFLLENDNQVSRLHANLLVGSDGLTTLSDNGSTNGTWVNGARIIDMVLAPGDTVQIGTTQFKVEA